MKSKYSKVKITALTLTFVCATTAMVGATTLQYGDKGKSVTANLKTIFRLQMPMTWRSGVSGLWPWRNVLRCPHLPRMRGRA